MDYDSKAYPATPGVYLFKDKKGRILYVGKAKSLRNRLNSYFRPGAKHTPKTKAMLAKADHVDILHVSSEKEALLLEESLIKKHRPRYNIVLKDDKQYILFRLTKGHEFPKLVLTRKVVRDGSVYFGPYTSAGSARETLKVLGRVFPLRKCADHVFKNRSRPCLYHDIGQCAAPCVLKVDREEYASWVHQVELVLTGHSRDLVKMLMDSMHRASDNLEFEMAARYRDRIRAIENTVQKQVAVTDKSGDKDVVALAAVENGVGLGLVFVRDGRILDQKRFFFAGMTLDEGPEIVQSFLVQFYSAGRFIPARIVVPYQGVDPVVETVLSERARHKVIVRQSVSGVEKSLVGLARTVAAKACGKTEQDISAVLAAKLKLPHAVSRIECIDASHLAGKDVRVGQVVFIDGETAKDQYRLYKMEHLEGSFDDYAAMACWTERRLESGEPWPDLVLLDGGKGQLAVVEKTMDKLDMAGVFPLAAIAKGPTRKAGELEDKIFIPGRKNPLNLKAASPELLMLQRIRDEAHRFVIGRQRQARKKNALKSELTSLPGIGPKTARLLWDRFGSIQAMARAKVDELAEIPGIGKKRAKDIHDNLVGNADK